MPATVPTIRRSDKSRSIPAVAVFARAPIPGKTKTRLIPALGPDGSAEFHRALLMDTLGKVAAMKSQATRYLFVTGNKIPEDIVPRVFQSQRQKGRDLDQRLEHAFTQLLQQHTRVIIIGTDSPMLAPAMLRIALEEMRTTDSVLGPCPDGGYYLIGLRRTIRGLFAGIRMGTQFAFQDTLTNLLTHGFSCSVLESCPDIDHPSDLLNLVESLVRNPGARRRVPQTWRFLSKID